MQKLTARGGRAELKCGGAGVNGGAIIRRRRGGRGGEAAEDFVDDGSGEAGVVVGSDGAVRAAADEQDFVADSSLGDIGDVDHGEIHADVAGDGGVVVAQDDLATVGEMATESVSVADGDDGEAGGARGVPSRL